MFFASGVSIELFLDLDNYMQNNLTKNDGARVIIHSPYSSPMPDEYGVDVAPNSAVSVGLSMV